MSLSLEMAAWVRVPGSWPWTRAHGRGGWALELGRGHFLCAGAPEGERLSLLPCEEQQVEKEGHCKAEVVSARSQGHRGRASLTEPGPGASACSMEGRCSLAPSRLSCSPGHAERAQVPHMAAQARAT